MEDNLIVTAPDPINTKSVQLFYNPVCPFSQRVRLALHIKEVEFREIAIHLVRKPEWFLKINPLGTTPTLEHNGQFIPDSKIAMEYIDEAFPSERKLFSVHLMEKAQQKIFVEEFGSLFLTNYFKILKSVNSDDSGGYKGIKAYLQYFDDFLSKQDTNFIAGNIPWFTDYAIYPFFERLESLANICSKDLALWLNTDGQKSVPRYFEYVTNMQKDPSVIATSQTTDQHQFAFKTFKEGNPLYAPGTKMPIYAAPPKN